jgi:hypothetical protein
LIIKSFFLTQLAAAFRKSYNLRKSEHRTKIIAGIIGISAALALVPAIPIYVAIAGAIH